jgi:hypothetical protein
MPVISLGKVSNQKDFAALVSEQLKAEGKSEAQYDLAKASEVKAASSKLFETKANEVIHTGNTNFGAELIQGAVTTSDFIDLATADSSALSFFQGFHGRDMDMTTKVPAIGELDYHGLASEWVDDTTNPAAAMGIPTGKMPTATVQIDQQQYTFKIDLSDKQSRFSVVDVVQKLTQLLGKSAGRTILATAFNGDTVTTTANINNFGIAPALNADGTRKYFLGANGLRKAGIAAGGVNVGTLTFDQLMSVAFALNDNWNSPEDVAFFMDRGSYNKTLLLNEFKTNSVNGRFSTVNTGAVSNVAGSDVFVLGNILPKTDANGRVDASTPANNTKGTIIAAHKFSLQYGFNGNYEIEIFRIPTVGWRIAGHYYAGFAVADSLTGMPTATSRLVAAGINVTI